MIIGEDYDKIEFSLFNLDLLEPNTFITDTLIALVAFSFAFILRKNYNVQQPFYKYWMWLFILQGTSFFLGGFGHVLYNYTGVVGKYFPLILGIGFNMMAEHAMISLLNENIRKPLFFISKLKSILAFGVLTTLMFIIDVENNLGTILFVPSLNTTLGYVLGLGVLGWLFARKTTTSFYLLPLSVLTLIPAAIVQAKKISFHQWFDRNDFSHLLIICALFMYYYAIKGYKKYEAENAIFRNK